METTTELIISSGTSTSSAADSPFPFPDWDQTFTDEELQHIDAAVESATASANKRRLPSFSQPDHHGPPKMRRSLPTYFSFTPPQWKERFPSFCFGGQIMYSRTFIEVERAAAGLLHKIYALKKLTTQVTLGFDVEWRPTFKKGEPLRKVAVLQICGDKDHCYVMHIIHSGIPRSLRLLLEDSAVLKVGVAIAGDARKMRKDYNISVESCQDLSELANQKLGHDSCWSLASLVENLTRQELPKPQKIRLGNWEAASLSKEQLKYAATDAFASWHVHQVLKTLPDVEVSRSEPDNENKEVEVAAAAASASL